MVKGDGLGLVGGDPGVVGRQRVVIVDHIIIPILFTFQYAAADGINIVIIIKYAPLEADVEVCAAVVFFQFTFHVCDFRPVNTCVVQGNFHCLSGRKPIWQFGGLGFIGILPEILPVIGDHGTGGGINIVFKFRIRSFEGNIIDEDSIVGFQLTVKISEGFCGNICMAQGSGLRFLGGDTGVGKDGSLRLIAIVTLSLDHLTGFGINVIFKFRIRGMKLHFIDHFSCIIVQVDLQIPKLLFGNSGVFNGGQLCGFGANVVLFAGSAGGIDTLQMEFTGNTEQI